MARQSLKEKFNPDRERFSNFVIDLRQNLHTTTSDTASLNQSNSLSQGHLSRRAWWRLKRIKIIRKRPRIKKNKNSHSLKNGFSNIRKKKFINSRKHWSQIIREREKILSVSPRYLLKEIRNMAQAKPSRVKTKARLLKYKLRFWKHPLALFILVLLVIILSLEVFSGQPWRGLESWQQGIRDQSLSAMSQLIAAGNSVSQLNLTQANANFQSASANFLAADNQLNQISSALLVLGSLSSDPKLKLASQGQKFLMAGSLASKLGSDLVNAVDSLFTANSDNLSVRLNKFLSYGHDSVVESQTLVKVLSNINPANIPQSQRSDFISLRQQVDLMSQALADFISAGDQLKEALGLTRNKRYLLVFQNNAEMRASGGFIGSYALMDLKQGKIINLEVPGGGSYDTAGGLTAQVVAPQPLWLLSPLWHFWDANWWPDWPTSAKNLMWFYGQSGGPSVDGVISFTPTVVEDLLKITGPINLPDYGLTIDSDNFWSTVQTITEQNNLAKTNPGLVANLPTSTPTVVSDLPLQQNLELNPGNKPKKIIGDLLAKIWQILPQKMNTAKFLQAASFLQKDLSGKQILFYFNDPKLEKAVTVRGWGGQIKTAAKDYLMVVNSNIGGQKSDQVIKEKISQSSSVQSDGRIIDTVQITRTHNGLKHTPLTGVRNVDWLRVYVPGGSKLISATGWRSPDASYLEKRPKVDWQVSPLLTKENAAAIDPSSGTHVYTENGKTVFANWSMLDPGQSVTITLTYRLPFNFFVANSNQSWLEKILVWFHLAAPQPWSYSLLVQKQPGSKNDDFTSNLTWPDVVSSTDSVFWSYPREIASSSGWRINRQLDSDQYYVILLKPNNNSQ